MTVSKKLKRQEERGSYYKIVVGKEVVDIRIPLNGSSSLDVSREGNYIGIAIDGQYGRVLPTQIKRAALVPNILSESSLKFEPPTPGDPVAIELTLIPLTSRPRELIVHEAREAQKTDFRNSFT